MFYTGRVELRQLTSIEDKKLAALLTSIMGFALVNLDPVEKLRRAYLL